MKNQKWKPFMMFGVIIVLIFFFGLIFLAMMFSRANPVGPETTQGGWWPGMWGMGPGMWGMGPFMMIFPCFGLIAILCVAFFFFRMMTGGGGPMSGMMGRGGPMSGMMGYSHDPQDKAGSSASTRDTALDTLKERYARGEITKAEYEEIRDDLAI